MPALTRALNIGIAAVGIWAAAAIRVDACEHHPVHHRHKVHVCACSPVPVKGVFFRLPRCFGPLWLCGYDR